MLSGEAAKDAFIARNGIPSDTVFQGILVCFERGLMEYDETNNTCPVTSLGKLYISETDTLGRC